MNKLSTLCALSSIVLLLSCAKSTDNDSGKVVKEKYVHKYGVEVQGADWEKRGKNGEIISTLDNGVTVTKHYKSGTLEGDAKYTFPHSDRVEIVETYSNGDLLKRVTHSEMGIPETETNFTPDGYQIVTAWYDSGIPKSKEMFEGDFLVDGEYYTLANQLESRVDDGVGSRVIRDRYGDLASTDSYEAGELTKRTEYFPNGSIRAVTDIRNNLADGYRKTYHHSGEPDSIEQWQNGRQQGVAVVFKNGEKYAEVPYNKGRKEGVEKRFRDNDIVIEEITWKNGVRHGAAFTFVDGKLSRTVWYYQDKPVSKSTYEQGNTAKPRRV